MGYESFKGGWVVRPKVSIFAQLFGPAAEGDSVTLPHDAVITLEHGGERAYFPGGVFEYSKTFDVPEAWRTKRVSLEFGGVYRDAVVFVNSAAAGQRPYGYSSFNVGLDSFLRYGEPNTVRVEARAHGDSRWYTGAGVANLVRAGHDDPGAANLLRADRQAIYLEFLGFTLDFGGPTTGGDSPFYGQVSKAGATLQLTEHRYEPGPGATVDIWITGLDAYREGLIAKDLGVFGPALGVPPIAETHWGARVLTIPDPFGNHLRISEPTDPGADANLPDWSTRP